MQQKKKRARPGEGTAPGSVSQPDLGPKRTADAAEPVLQSSAPRPVNVRKVRVPRAKPHAAFEWLSAGHAICLVDPGGKAPLGALHLNGHLDATSDEHELRAWLRNHPNANYGIVPADGTLVLDIDPQSGGIASLDNLERVHGVLPDTTHVLTGEHDGVRGRHIYFRSPGLKPSKGRLAEGVEYKVGNKGYLLGPGSRHASGVAYELFGSPHELGDAPTWLRDLVGASGQARAENARYRQLIERLQEYAAEHGLPPPRPHGDGLGYDACCPAHDDNEPSLSVRPGDRQPVVLHCHAGCEPEAVLRALGLDWDDVSDAGGRQPTQAALVIDLVHELYEIFVSPAEQAYALPKEGPRIARPLVGKGGSLRGSIAKVFYDRYGKTAQPTALTGAFEVLTAEAIANDPREVHLRCARTPDGLVIDPGWTDGRAIIISEGSWRLADGPPDGTLFRRTRLTGQLPHPSVDGDLDLLRELINVTDQGWDLVRAWLAMAWMPDIPVPILAALGSQGAGKSVLGRTLVRIVDPGPSLLRKPPKDPENWITAAAGSRVVGLDNLSSIPEWLSDALCRAVTGDGDVKRMLYADDDLVVFNFRRAILLTSIDPGSLRGDLGERLLPVELPRPASRLPERKLDEHANAALPRIVGGLLDLVARIDASHVTLDNPPRMADAAEVMASMDSVTGSAALATYEQTRLDVVEKVLESDVVASALLRFMEKRQPPWEGQAEKLYRELELYAPPGRRQWPGNARVLSQRLNRAAPTLESARGLLVSFRKLHGRAIIELRWHENGKR